MRNWREYDRVLQGESVRTGGTPVHCQAGLDRRGDLVMGVGKDSRQMPMDDHISCSKYSATAVTYELARQPGSRVDPLRRISDLHPVNGFLAVILTDTLYESAGTRRCFVCG